MIETRYRALSLAIACLSVLVITSTLGAAPAYPVKVGPTGRDLVDQNGVPFLIVGDSPQAMIGRLSEADAELFFANRQAHGFNTVWINLLCASYIGCNADGSTFDGIAPFNVPGDLTTPNEAYFAKVDAILRLAARYGLLVILDPAETGDWLAVLYANGEDNCRAYGQSLGQRYASFDNILWMHGNDYQDYGPDSDRFTTAVARGIKDFDSRHLHTVELNFFVSSSTDDPAWHSIIDINAAYSSYEPVHAEILKDYNHGDFPVFLVESGYEFEVSDPRTVRAQAYEALLSGATGHLYGNHYTWQFLDGWQDTLESSGTMQVGYFAALVQSRPWYDLVPDQDHALVTSGVGDFGAPDYVTAARTPDGRLAIAYVPTSRTITVDLGRLGGLATARWLDPTSGTFMTISDSLANSGVVDFTTPGTNSVGAEDWVLVLETGAPQTPPPPPSPPSSFVELTIASDTYARGDQLDVFLTAFNSAQRSTRELYAGVVLPDGETVAYFTSPSVIGGVTRVDALGALRPLTRVAPGELVVLVDGNAVLTGKIPDGVAPGTYTWFALLVAPGALGDNRFDPAEVDIVAVRAISVLP
jgi:Protein of unknown function (DUF4038)/Putative collagen-binding domain of a collagenase